LFCGDGLAACIKGFPYARFIHLTRHPASSLVSLQKHSPCPPRPAESLTEWCANVWYTGHLRIIRFLSSLPRSQWFRVRGEDLIGKPAAWLPKILRWLDLDAAEDLVSRMLLTERWRFAHRGESGLLCGADPTFLNSPRLQSVPEPGPISFDPRWQLSDQTVYRLTALASYLGY
jgi:Sulfotransferase family